jgi:hypothetical protein
MGNKWNSLYLKYKAWSNMWSQQFVKEQNRKKVWIHLFYVFHHFEEQRQNMTNWSMWWKSVTKKQMCNTKMKIWNPWSVWSSGEMVRAKATTSQHTQRAWTFSVLNCGFTVSKQEKALPCTKHKVTLTHLEPDCNRVYKCTSSATSKSCTESAQQI